MKKRLSSLIAAFGFWCGKAMSSVLSYGHRLVGKILDYWVSSRLQRLFFMAFARINARNCAIVCIAGTSLLAYLFPTEDATAMGGLATALLALNVVPLQSMYFRLRRGPGALLVTSCYGRELRVHFPRTTLLASDVPELRSQVTELVALARTCRAKALTFRSPLLTAKSTSTLLVRQLVTAARSVGVEVSVRVHEPREVGAVSSGTLSAFEGDYAALRDGRLIVGSQGRLLARKVEVEFR
ncbi:hypothetical protein [Paraburkholderia bannensis]|uniref:hypothetical protein n=1 Tax=Paraburkholderia bannensis TaxID=765414 RepID=UPI002AB64D66|nr:hypothetical protein [Paraburkholderia bannensis]